MPRLRIGDAEKRETESALNLTTTRLMALVEASPNAALIESAAGEVELVNEAFCRLLGLESAPQSLLGLPAVEVIGRSKAILSVEYCHASSTEAWAGPMHSRPIKARL